MSKNLDTSSEEVTNAITSVLAGTETYAIFTHNGRTSTIVVHKVGSMELNNADEFWKDFLQEELMTYAYVRLSADSVDSEATRFAFLSWRGPNVGIVFRNKFVFFFQGMTSFMNGKCHGTMEVEAPLDLNALKEQLLPNDQGLYVTSSDGKTKRLSVSEAINSAKSNSFNYASVKGSTTSLPPMTSFQKEVLLTKNKEVSLSNSDSSSKRASVREESTNHQKAEEDRKKAEAEERARQDESARKEEAEQLRKEEEERAREREAAELARQQEEERARQQEEVRSRQQEEEERARLEEVLRKEQEEADRQRKEQEEADRQHQEEKERARQEAEAQIQAEKETEEPPQEEYESEELPAEEPPAEEWNEEEGNGFLFTAVALWNFSTDNSEELSFSQGDVFNIARDEGSWYYAEKDGAFGFIPANYVEKQ